MASFLEILLQTKDCLMKKKKHQKTKNPQNVSSVDISILYIFWKNFFYRQFVCWKQFIKTKKCMKE